MSEMKVTELFGSMVFNEDVMKQRLSGQCYKEWKKCVTDGTPLELSTAHEIANAMKDWALEKGATHYTHWFQPMTGVTAEKHDSFITPDGDTGRVLMQCLLLPLRRPAGHLRGPGLHRLGPQSLRLHQGRKPVHPHHFLLLQRPGPGQKDAPSPLHG